MYPNLIEIGGVTITTFGFMMFLSFIVAAWATAPQLARRGLRPELAWDVLLWVAVGGIAGAKLYYVALNIHDPIPALLSRAGLVWYGGLIGGVLAYYWQIRARRLPVAPMFDAVAPALAIAYAVGRLGCFLVGDDYGLPTNAWYGIAFPQGAPPSTAGYLRSVGGDVPAAIPDWQVIAVHPTQLYEVGLALLMFAVLWHLAGRRLLPGRLFGAYLMLYGLERFVIEFVRAKSDRYFLGLSTSQFASLALLAIGFYLWEIRPRGVPQTAGAPAPVTPPGKRKAKPAPG
jgi:phosphatidylglycerol---prolipoprotein diacylglyceryl transferase